MQYEISKQAKFSLTQSWPITADQPQSAILSKNYMGSLLHVKTGENGLTILTVMAQVAGG